MSVDVTLAGRAWRPFGAKTFRTQVAEFMLELHEADGTWAYYIRDGDNEEVYDSYGVENAVYPSAEGAAQVAFEKLAELAYHERMRWGRAAVLLKGVLRTQ